MPPFDRIALSSNVMVRAVIYLRASLDQTGEELTVRRHEIECREIAAQRGWDVIDVFTDNNKTASSRKKRRPDYDRMEQLYHAGGFDALLCHDLDRLMRQPRQLEDWIEAAEERGLIVLTSNGEADLSTDGGRMYARVKVAVARAEIERKGARQKSAAVQRSQLGRPPLGVRLTGYTAKGEVIPEEAGVVRVIFDRFYRGDSIKAITRGLSDAGIRTRHGGPWNPSTVGGALRNERYAGRAIYMGKANGVRGNWEPLVSEEVFDAIKVKLADPRRRMQQGTDRKHLGSGLYLCGVCEQPVSSWSGQRYRCKNACSNRSRPKIDEAVEIQVRRRLSRPDLADLLPPQENVEAQRLSGEMTRLRTRLLTVEGDYDAGTIDGRRYAIATEKINAELATVQAAFAAASRGQEAAALRGGDPLGAYDGGSLMMKQAIIRALCVVRLHPAPRGRKTFDPDSVQVEWLAADG